MTTQLQLIIIIIINKYLEVAERIAKPSDLKCGSCRCLAHVFVGINTSETSVVADRTAGWTEELSDLLCCKSLRPHQEFRHVFNQSSCSS